MSLQFVRVPDDARTRLAEGEAAVAGALRLKDPERDGPGGCAGYVFETVPAVADLESEVSR